MSSYPIYKICLNSLLPISGVNFLKWYISAISTVAKINISKKIFPNVPICECLKLRQTRLENKFEQTMPSLQCNISLENLYEHFS